MNALLLSNNEKIDPGARIPSKNCTKRPPNHFSINAWIKLIRPEPSFPLSPSKLLITELVKINFFQIKLKNLKRDNHKIYEHRKNRPAARYHQKKQKNWIIPSDRNFLFPKNTQKILLNNLLIPRDWKISVR